MKRNQKIGARIQSHLNKAHNLAYAELVKYARRILMENPDLQEFVMSMGRWLFKDKKNNLLNETDDDRLKSFADFVSEWDNHLKLTGVPIRFTAKGKARYEW